MTAANQARAAKQGFTLVELLVSIAVIGLLVGLLLPAVQSAREAGRRSECLNHLRQLGTGFHMFHTAKGRFPSAYESSFSMAGPHGPPDPVTRDCGPGWAWGVQLLPFLEDDALFAVVDRSLPCWDPANASLLGKNLAIFLCPSATSAEGPVEIKGSPGRPATFGRSCYVANVGQEEPWGFTVDDYLHPAIPNSKPLVDGPLYRNSRTRSKDITDGLSKTVFLGEHHPVLSEKTWVGVVPGAKVCPSERFAFSSCDHAATLVQVHSGPASDESPPAIHPPNSPLCHVCQMYSEHQGGCQVLLGDGSARFVSQMINQLVWSALASIAKNDSVPGEY